MCGGRFILGEKLFTAFIFTPRHSNGMTKGRRDFDLPIIHLTEEENYIPPRARDATEIVRRRNLRPGTLILEQQAVGLNVAVDIFNYPVDQRQDRDFIHDRVASALMNTAWYTFGDHTPDIIMRRRLKLPVLADDQAGVLTTNESEIDDHDYDLSVDEAEETLGWRETREGLLAHIRTNLSRSAVLGHRLTFAHTQELNTMKLYKQLGRAMGNTALAITSLPLADAPKGMSEEEIQNVVLMTGNDLLERSRVSHQVSGFHASVAQLADSESPLSRAWRRDAPKTNQAHDALVEAQSGLIE